MKRTFTDSLKLTYEKRVAQKVSDQTSIMQEETASKLLFFVRQSLIL